MRRVPIPVLSACLVGASACADDAGWGGDGALPHGYGSDPVSTLEVDLGDDSGWSMPYEGPFLGDIAVAPDGACESGLYSHAHGWNLAIQGITIGVVSGTAVPNEDERPGAPGQELYWAPPAVATADGSVFWAWFGGTLTVVEDPSGVVFAVEGGHRCEVPFIGRLPVDSYYLWWSEVTTGCVDNARATITVTPGREPSVPEDNYWCGDVVPGTEWANPEGLPICMVRDPEPCYGDGDHTLR